MKVNGHMMGLTTSLSFILFLFVQDGLCMPHVQASSRSMVDSRVIQILVSHPELTTVLVNYLRLNGDFVSSPNDVDSNGFIKLDERLLRALVRFPEAVDIILNYDNNEVVRRAASVRRRSHQYRHPSYIFKSSGLLPKPRRRR
eukprot:TRINITY_DN22037_c0_g1_i1.p1 TRINITY_DN22037_c0_g1~~TRINITY_DN22037_c0_g1_i1.p1  ORF type:complete len:143 (+),score=28.21 TRINITY_DN22037_c0_g1_i1:33-461(+)